MPLRAFFANEEIISILLTDDQWIELKAKIKLKGHDLIIGQTGKKGYPRKSKTGLKHFVHLPGEQPKNWKPESRQHLTSKCEIIEAAIELGWIASPEYKGNDWIADVLVWKGEKKIAFEVQWSKQTYDRTLERQEKYRRENVRCCWFFKNPPHESINLYKNLIAKNELPLFKIFENENGKIFVNFNNKVIELKEYIKLLLTGQITFAEKINLNVVKPIEVIYNFYNRPCYKCNTWQYKYWVDNINGLSACGKPLHFFEKNWEYRKLRFQEEITKGAKEICAERKLTMANILPGFSNTVNKSYIAFHCYKCDALWGDFFLEQEERKAIKILRISKLITLNSLAEIEKEEHHWCYSKFHK